jgi:predicted RNA-binding Zn-ribbon protein involved in translation (DUF1610 family)
LEAKDYDPLTGGLINGVEMSVPQGYCVKERKKVAMKDAVEVTLKNGHRAVSGTCPDCGTKMFKLGRMDPGDRPGAGRPD